MFRAVTGGSTGGNLFNLNWVELGGTGVAATVMHLGDNREKSR